MNKLAGKKLTEAREAIHLTQSEMAQRLGEALGQTYSLRQYQKLEEGRFPIHKKSIVEKLDKILATNLYALIYEQDVPRATPVNGHRNYIEERREKKNQHEPIMVPLVPVKAHAGYAHSYANSEFIEKLDVYPILPGIDPRGAVWRYFEVQGDSMEPGLYETDIVLVSMVPPEDWRDNIKKGQVYVIVTAEDVLIKLVYPKDRETWILDSSNKRHKQRIIALKDIKEVWQYRRLQRNKIQWQHK